MVRYFCDRCKKQIGNGICAPSVPEIGIIYTSKSDGRSTKRNGTRRDLCDTCQYQLNKWWEEGSSLTERK